LKRGLSGAIPAQELKPKSKSKMKTIRPVTLISVEGGTAHIMAEFNVDIRDNDNYEAASADLENAEDEEERERLKEEAGNHAPFTDEEIEEAHKHNQEFRKLFKEMSKYIEEQLANLESEQESGFEDGIYDEEETDEIKSLRKFVKRIKRVEL
jgi:hypothetical protein